MLSLIIETSTDKPIVALVEGRNCIAKSSLAPGFEISRFLLPEIQKLLLSQGTSINKLCYIACGCGPGSYTGSRVGAITAKTLSFASEIPLIGICSLATFCPPADGAFACLFDAKISGAYIIKGTKKAGSVSYDPGPSVVSLEALSEDIRHCGYILSPHSQVLKNKTTQIQGFPNIQWIEAAPDPVHIASLAEEKLANDLFTTDGSMEILYLRKTQAEIERENLRQEMDGGTVLTT